ncbi:NAD-dependent epimerase/dehydratase family protein [Luteibacter yeojuensis]
MKRAFVTGGSGFLGGVLITRLRKAGVEVVALARSQASLGKVTSLGALPFPGDVTDTPALEAGMRGCDVVFHTAAHFTEWDAYDRFYQSNVLGTACVLRAAANAGVPTLVAVGASGVFMGKPEPLSKLNETAPLHEPTWAPYTATKAEAQRLVLAANSIQLRTVVIDPPLIWGLSMPMLDDMLPMIDSGAFALPDGGVHLMSTCHVDNVVEGLLLAAERGRGGQSYFVTDGDDISFKQLAADLLSTRSRPPIEKSAPFALAWFVATLLEPVWRALELKGKPPVTRQMLRMIGKEFTLDTTKARTELGYAPIVSRKDGLDQMRAARVARAPS